MNHLSSFTQQSVNVRISKSIPGFMDKVSLIQDHVVDLFDDFHEFNECHLAVSAYYKMQLVPIYSAEISGHRSELFFNKYLFEKPGRINLTDDKVFYSITLSFQPVQEANYYECYDHLSLLYKQMGTLGLIIFGLESKYDYVLSQVDDEFEVLDSFEDNMNLDYSKSFEEPKEFGDGWNIFKITWFDMCLVHKDDMVAQKQQW